MDIKLIKDQKACIWVVSGGENDGLRFLQTHPE